MWCAGPGPSNEGPARLPHLASYVELVAIISAEAWAWLKDWWAWDAEAFTAFVQRWTIGVTGASKEHKTNNNVCCRAVVLFHWHSAGVHRQAKRFGDGRPHSPPRMQIPAAEAFLCHVTPLEACAGWARATGAALAVPRLSPCRAAAAPDC